MQTNIINNETKFVVSCLLNFLKKKAFCKLSFIFFLSRPEGGGLGKDEGMKLNIFITQSSLVLSQPYKSLVPLIFSLHLQNLRVYRLILSNSVGNHL